MKKTCFSQAYNYYFDTETGEFCRWGVTKEDDPDWSPNGPEILDLEISTICSKGCDFCYKDNSIKGENMSFETFQKIFHKMPKNLTQIAFGVGDLDTNPDLFKILEYCRINDYNMVIPNITINDVIGDDKKLEKLVKLCGAIAVSYYGLSSIKIVQKLIDLGCKQVNFHYVLSEESKESIEELFVNCTNHAQLGKLNALVFLCLKPKGRGKDQSPVKDISIYKKLYELSKKYGVDIGFDSCSANTFLKAMEGCEDYNILKMCVEPCESGLFSSYINVRGHYFPCSFCEGEEGYTKGINVLECDDFLLDIWLSDEVIKWRDRLIENKRSCPVFNLTA